jgi:DNA-binding transcriptional LysR family regulator
MWSIDMLLHLRAFVTVAELESFSRAADELMIGQPLLSRRIKSLEAEIGAELFDRSRRQITITDLGRTIFDSARDLLARADLLEEFVRVSQGRDRLRLGIPPDCDPRAIARVVTRAAEDGQRIEIVELAGSARDSAIDDGSVELALLRKPADAAGFVVELGLASAHPLHQTGDSGSEVGAHRPVRLDALRPRRGAGGQRRRVLVSAEDDRPAFMNNLTRIATRAGLTVAQLEIVPSTQSALVRVLAGNDVILSSRQFAARNRLEWAPLADARLRRTYQLAVVPSLEGDVVVHGLLTRLAPLLGSMVDAAPRSRAEGVVTNTGAHPLVEDWG